MNPSSPRNPDYASKVRSIIDRAAFIRDLGVTLVALTPGECETLLPVQPRFLQQDEVIHAGVQATLADHTAGAAAASLVGDDETVLTVEFKINLLRPAVGKALRARAEVLRAGRTIIVAEATVETQDEKDGWRPVAKSMVTLAVVKSQGY
jgi:uncharacterized protein (TIGR00369 family)